ncbi:zinc ABC transporter substrate-binding protein [Balneolaceae bacterium ANBcel3]|nr:zinc ABC transporter substrate-binding protein [Balneolaceae bacterium ANBcel3]
MITTFFTNHTFNYTFFRNLSPALITLFIFSTVFLSACSTDDQNDERFYVVTTTNIIYDAVQHIGGDDIRVHSLMGPGVDPHIYRATPRDFQRMEKADLIFYNGLFLEGRLASILDGQGERTYAVASAIPEELLIPATEFGGSFDPHVWFDASLWEIVVNDIARVLSEKLPEQEEAFTKRAQRLQEDIRHLHEETLARIQKIPENQRMLITAHDAFQYFGKAYGIEVRGLQGLSTASEYGIQDVIRMVNLVVERQIPAIFIETSVSTRAIESVIEGARNRGFDLRLGGELYSDSMGAIGTPTGTYTGMFRYNVDTIVQALTRNPEHPS